MIVAVEPGFQNPEKVILLHADHHDSAYQWSNRRHYVVDTERAVNLRDVAPPDAEPARALASLLDFEEWQLFLHPDQEPLVKRHYYGGEARIRGPAGTGKTVVALHRAAELGRRYGDGKVLFTTFSRSLTKHLRQLYERLPNARENVDFRNIDAVALDFVPERMKRRIDREKVDDAFETAYRMVVPGTVLERYSREYLRQEIDKVIKGRAATREEYLDTGRFERLGRRRQLNRAARELCWRLRVTWDEGMRKADTTNYPDRLIIARDRARARKAGGYRAAIVDESQDMTLVGMQLVRALVAGRPGNRVPRDGLLILDDTAQRIYAGGFRLTWADIRVTGRSAILQTNYRNTRPIIEAAKAVRGDVLLVKEDSDDGAAWHSDFKREEGPKPVFVRVAPKCEVRAIIDEIRKLVDEEGVAYEAIGVLMHHNDDANRVGKELRENDVPCAMLKKLRAGPLIGGVRVGTFDRSKGLEFHAVFIPRIGASVFPRNEGEKDKQKTLPGIPAPPREPTDEELEARQLDLDRLYVGMTRAKERLYLVADEEPGRELERARDLFERRRYRIGGPISSSW